MSVFASDELNRSVLAVAHDVACLIYANLCTWYFVTWNFHKRLCGLLGLVEITDTNLRSGYQQFACCTPRNTLAVLVDNKKFGCVIRITDGDIRLVLLHPETGDIDSALRRAVTIPQTVGWRIQRHQFFAPHAETLESGNIGIVDSHLRAYLGRHEGVRNALFDKIVIYTIQIEPYIFADNIYGCAGI